MKQTHRTLLLFVCLALAALPGSHLRSGDLTFSIALSGDRIHVQQNEDGTSSITVGARGTELYSRVNDEGLPALPYRVVQVLLPSGRAFESVEAHKPQWRSLAANFHPELARTEIVHGTAPTKMPAPITSGGPEAFPERTVRYLGTGTWHGRSIASFAVFPLRVAAGELQYAPEVEFTLRTAAAPAPESAARPQRLGKSRARRIEAALASTVVNPEAAATYPDLPATATPRGGFQPTVAPSLEGSPVEYVIITTEALAASYQRLADWRTARGMPAVVRTIEWIEDNYRRGSDTQETIRHFIQDAYAKWGAEFFLLGGDTPEVPPRYLYTTYYYGGTYIPADIYYEGLDGTWNDDHDGVFGEMPVDNPDLYPEVYVCRLPTSTTSDVDLLTDKVIEYETTRETAYAERLLFLAEVLFPTPWNPGDPIQEDGASIAEFLITKHLSASAMSVDRSYENYTFYPGADPESRAAAIDSMNVGFGHIYHIGHGYRFNLHCGDDNVTIPDADALTNTNRNFNLLMLNCTANAFDFDCLGEHFLRNPGGGAVSVIGAANSAFATVSTYYMDEYTNLVFDEDVVRVGEAHARSRLPRAAIALLSDNADYWTHLIFAPLADPAMQFYNGPTDTFVVGHPDTIPSGEYVFVVAVTSGGAPFDSAQVCVWKGDEDYQVMTTDINGLAPFFFTSETAGSLSVVVTGLNHPATVSKIYVAPTPGAYLAFAGTTVDDDSLGGTYGNGDGVIDAGETVDLTPQVVNTGDAASQAATMTLASSCPFVTIVDTVASVGAVGVGQTLAAANPWRITIAPAAGDESVCEFGVAIDDGVGAWNDEFARVLHAPVLEFTTIRVDDSVLGDGNGVITSGEEFRLYYALKNYGTGTAFGLGAVLADASGGGVTVVESVDAYPDLAPLVEGENQIGFRLSEVSSVVENDIAITVTDLFGRTVTDTFELRPPDPPSNLSFDASLGEDRILVSWDAGPSGDAARYHVYHSTTPGGPYTRATGDAVLHSTSTVVGLSPSTRYYFVVTTIDTSGNESVASAEASASTNPQQAPGWPNSLAGSSVDSPILGDIDGDNDLEVITGNDYVYAWHHDGQEIRDGDGEALTYGVFSDQGEDFLAPIALAKIDGEFGLDIIAASWTSQEVFIFNHSGDVLPGWPQPTIDKVRASVAVGDLDGDDSPEIVAIDEEAYMYAWNADGTEFRDGDADTLTQGVFYRFPDTPWWQYQSPCLADIDNDGADEIIIGTQDSKLYVLNGDGSDVPGWPRTLSSFAGGGFAVGDIDDNGDLDIVVPTKNTGEVMALRPDNTILWIRWFAQNLFFNPSPALADIDDNGTLETFLPSSNGSLYGLASNGANLPGWPVVYSTSTYTESSPIIADITGDGVADILLGDESKFINAWDIAGNPIDGFPLVTLDAVRGTPAVADLDRDGDTEIVAAGFDRTVYVWDLTSQYRPLANKWPMFKANWHRNGRYEYMVPTAVTGVAFTHQITDGAVVAWWEVPLELGSTFDVDRAVVVEGDRGGFGRVATGVGAPGGTVEFIDREVHEGMTYVYRLIPVDEPGAGEFLSEPIRIPVTHAGLEQNFPNPFNPATTIVYFVPDAAATAPVSLVVYDVTGARVRTLVDGAVAAGRHTLEWDGRNDDGNRVGSGVYFYRLVQKGFTATRKMVLLK